MQPQEHLAELMRLADDMASYSESCPVPEKYELARMALQNHAVRVTNHLADVQEQPLVCDFCGTDTPNPWHGSTLDDKHLHACEKCLHLLPGHAMPAQVQPLTDGKDAEIAALRKDAERYRWLRDACHTNREPHISQYPAQEFDNPQRPQILNVGTDAAIDAAMAQAVRA